MMGEVDKATMTEVGDFYGTIVGDSTALGKLLSKIPGLSGYMERERRRDADALLRETVSARLEQSRVQLGTIQASLSRDIVMGIQYAEPLGRVNTQLVGLASKIHDAPQGYAGFFSAVKVQAEDLARLYSFDEQMLNYSDQINSDVAALGKAVADGANIDAAIAGLSADLLEANQVFNSRQEVLNKVK